MHNAYVLQVNIVSIVQKSVHNDALERIVRIIVTFDNSKSKILYNGLMMPALSYQIINH